MTIDDINLRYWYTTIVYQILTRNTIFFLYILFVHIYIMKSNNIIYEYNNLLKGWKLNYRDIVVFRDEKSEKLQNYINNNNYYKKKL